MWISTDSSTSTEQFVNSPSTITRKRTLNATLSTDIASRKLEGAAVFKSALARLREAHMCEVEGEGVAEGGFTLIELMVVLLIIAILLAIAIPTFLGATASARDRAVQSNLTNANTEVEAQYQNGESYAFAAPGGGQPALNTSAPEFTWVDGGAPSIDQNHMSVGPFDLNSAGDQQGMVIASLNQATGTCWYVMKLQANPTVGVPPAGVTVSRAGTYYANQTSTAGKPCQASNATGTAGWNWGTSYSDTAGDNG